MDDIIKLIQELMSKKPTPKGGIADTVAGVEFIGKKLSKEQVGDFTIIGSKLTDASRFRPFDVRNVGRDNRYMYMRDYADELQSNFEKTLRFIQDNPDIRLTQAQKDNVFYNLGVYRRVNAEKTKLEKGYIDEGKNPEEIYKKTDDERPLEELPFVKVLERTKKTIDEFQKKVKETEDIFKPPSAEELSAGQIRYNKLYDGPGYTSGNSSLYRGYGSSFLPRLHEKGIIKLDDEIYQNLKQGKHHYGGADFFAPDPIRIWRKHFGDDVFKKLDNFDPDNEDIFQWLSRNNIQPTNRVGPKNALEYMNSTEIGQRLTDEAQLLNKYKNPASQGDNAKYYYVDKPDQRMERITYHGENIQGYETALQKMDPEAYNKYAAEFRQATNDANVIPFNKDEGIRAIAADSEEGKEITKGILDLADRSSGENIVALADPVSDAIAAIKGLEPMDAMKEANLVAGKQGKYADLSDEQVNKIIEDTNDHIFERDPIEPEDFAKGGRVDFNQGSGPAGAGLASLTPYQEEYYNDKIIRDNMDFIREDMSLYFDEDTRSDFQKYIDALTRDDVYDEYDEKKGYTGMFKENFTTKDGKDITIPYKPDRNLDIQGLLQLFDESDRGVSSSDETIFNSSDILGRFSNKEREV
jgi:hypothetical protein